MKDGELRRKLEKQIGDLPNNPDRVEADDLEQMSAEIDKLIESGKRSVISFGANGKISFQPMPSELRDTLRELGERVQERDQGEKDN